MPVSFKSVFYVVKNLAECRLLYLQNPDNLSDNTEKKVEMSWFIPFIYINRKKHNL